MKEDIVAIMMTKKDKAELKDLEKIIEEQSKELTLRSKTVDALQRNFESLSEFCKAEKIRTQHLLVQVEELTKENERLTLKMKELAGAKHIAQKQEPVLDSKSLKSDMDLLKEQNSALQKTLQGKSAEIERLEDSLKKLKKPKKSKKGLKNI